MNRTHRPFVLLGLCVLIPVGAVYWLAPAAADRPATLNHRTVELAAAVTATPEYSVERFFIGQGGTLAAACDRLGLVAETRRLILETAGRHVDLRRLSPRTGVAVQRDGAGRLVSLAIRSAADRFLRITLPDGEGALRAELLPLAVQLRLETTGVVVATSVAQALEHTAYNRTLTQAYADIFQWDVDLLVDPRPGDEVKIVYEV